MMHRNPQLFRLAAMVALAALLDGMTLPVVAAPAPAGPLAPATPQVEHAAGPQPPVVRPVPPIGGIRHPLAPRAPHVVPAPGMRPPVAQPPTPAPVAPPAAMRAAAPPVAHVVPPGAQAAVHPVPAATQHGHKPGER